MKKTYVGISIHFFVVDGTKLFSQPYMESLKVWTLAKAEPVRASNNGISKMRYPKDARAT